MLVVVIVVLLLTLGLKLADALAPMVTEAVRIVARPTGPIDLFMVEILSMQHRSAMETRLVRGLVLDHGGRHPGMPKSLKNCWILVRREKEGVFTLVFLKKKGDQCFFGVRKDGS